MLSALRSNLLSLRDLLGVPDAVASVQALPWPGPLQRAARSSMDCLARRLPFLGEMLEPVREEPAPRRPVAVPTPESPPQKTVAALVAVLRGPVAEEAAQAAETLGTRRSARAREALLEALENRDGYFSPLTRVAAVKALARSADDDGPLCDAARDVDPDVSLAAIEALTARGGPAALAALAEIAEDDSVFFLPATRKAAAKGLATLRSAQ